MFFLNLTAGEFFALFAVLSGLVTALYLLDRTKRKKIVSTLRFWTPARTAEEQQSRRRMREPWSLLLQLIGLVLLLLAIAQLQWGSRQRRGRDHVLLFDVSAWSAEKTQDGTLLDREKLFARRYLAALPSLDRVLLVRADSLAVPVTPFTAERSQTLAGIAQSVSGFSALNLEQALSFAHQALSWSGGARGEIVYLGPRLTGDPPIDLDTSHLRVIDVAAARQNVGVRRLGVKRSEEDSTSWQASVTLKNFGTARRAVQLHSKFAGTVFATRSFNLAPGEETSADYNFTTNTAGQFVTGITPHDDLPSDDQAALQLPKTGPVRVLVFTSRPEMIKPLLAANRRLNVSFYAPSQYSANQPADVFVLDRFTPPARPNAPSLWIAPARSGSPLPVKSVLADAVVENWHSGTPLGNGLHAKEAHIPDAEVFETFEGDSAVATVAAGPIVVARPASPASPKLAIIGFDPLNGELKFQVTTPLLFANLLRWLSPETLRTVEFSAGRVGVSTVALDARERPEQIRVTDEKGFAVPFTIHGHALQLFASRPAIVRVLSEQGERLVSLTLPDVAEYEWKPPASVAHDLPPNANFVAGAIDLWKWLALTGAACLLAEWLIYGRQRILRVSKPAARRASAPQPELVSK